MGTAIIRIIGLGLGFLIGVQLARYLGVKEYGLYASIMSIVALLMLPTEMGLPRLLTREVSKIISGDEVEVKRIFYWGLSQVFKASVLIIIFIIGYFIFLNDKNNGYILVFTCLLVPLTAFLNIYCAVLRGLHFIAISQCFDTILRNGLYSALLFASFYFFNVIDARLAIFLSTFSVLVSLVFSYIFLNRKIKNLWKFDVERISKKKSKEYWSSAIPMALIEGMMVVRSNFQILLLGGLSTLTEVGLYKIAVSTLLVLSLPITVINISLAPQISRLFQQCEMESISMILKKSVIFLFLSTLFLFTPFIFFGHEIFAYVYGVEYIAANYIFIVLGVGMLISSFFGINAIFLNMTGHERYVLKSGVYSLVVMILISLPLIYLLEGVGAAISSSFALVFWSFLMWRFSKNVVGFETSLFSLINFFKK